MAVRIRPGSLAPAAAPTIVTPSSEAVARQPPHPSSVTAVVVTKRPWLASHVAKKLAWQTLQPELVVVCSAVPDYDLEPLYAALPHSTIGRVIADPSMCLGELRNAAMQIASEASNSSAIMCSIDDDDLYGPTYLEGIADGWRRHPDAMIVGRAAFSLRTVTEIPSEPPPVEHNLPCGLVTGIAGATISIPVAAWNAHPQLRYPSVAMGEDIALLAIAFAHRRLFGAYFGDFQAIRCDDARHEHSSPTPGTLRPAAPPVPVLTEQIQRLGSRMIRQPRTR